ncbi:ATP-binding protein [Thauera sp. Sel9]|uniref:ATP-binding protein n=1 Tax=Thauera sp. Sel9 TaxID=2974299 RepID=UPI0021E156A5|nr:ATP-binding protein [Thauera sp. Sel9]MCV2219662.1 ATP-binding protein [Thauera sp. Sel9]
MTHAIAAPSPAAAGRARRQWLRFVLPLLALSVLIGAIGAVGYRYLGDEIRRETHRTLAVVAEQKRQHIEDWLHKAQVDAELYFSGHSQLETLFGRWLDGGRQDGEALARMQELMREAIGARGWAGVALIDADGEQAFAVGDADGGAHAEAIAEVLRAPRVVLVDLYLSAQGEARYGVLAPVGRPGTTPRGVAYLTWRADETLFPMVEAWPVPTLSAETYLVRRDGAGVRFLTPLRHQEGTALVLTLPLDDTTVPAVRAAQGESGILAGGRDYRGVPVLAYAAAVGGTPWLMLAEIDEREAYAGIRTMSWATALATALGLLLVYSAGYLLWRRDLQRQELAALHAQRAAEARFRVVFEQAPLGVMLLDSRSGRITEANQRFADIVGRSAAELAGLSPLAFTHPDDIEPSTAQLARLGAGEITGYSLIKRYLRPDASVVWVSLSFAPVQVENEQAPRHLGMVEDITARKEMEERLRVSEARHRQLADEAAAANAAKSEFLAHMSHEIRTPMNAVLGLAQVLTREPLSGDQRDMVERIRSAGQSLLAILNDVLDLSKIEAGQLRIEPHTFDLAVLLANLDSLMSPEAHRKGLALRVQMPAPPPGLLRGDGLRLEQVLFNLVGNAIKFTGRGEVALKAGVLETDAERLRLRFEVRDTGIGIAPEAIGRLFTPFSQADAGIGRRFGGTGLGLSICKRLVELMGGTIGVDSQPGIGSTFWFELPLQRAAEGEAPASAAARPAAPAGPRLQGAQVLVVDDSAMNRDLAERALALEGAAATLAADGQQALQLLKARPDGFDAVLMDVQMPVMDGLSAMRAIRCEPGLAALPLIAFTAGVNDAQRAAALDAGADDVLAKPMDLDEMAALLARWIGSKAARTGPVPTGSACLPTGMCLPAEAGEEADVAAEAFPAIPGIDRERAAQRLGRDRSMFVGLLELFIEDNADAAERARRELAAGEREAAARRMHTLRSNAGFICAMELMEEAGVLEKAIEQGEPDLDARLAALGERIAALIEASAPWR